MATALLNGVPVISGAVNLPRIGVWHADLQLDAEDASAFTGGSTLELGGEISLACAVARAGLSRGTVFVRVIGGAGGLARQVQPKSYQDVPARLVLSELLTAVGESLSAQGDATVLGTRLPKWERLLQPASVALAQLLQELPDGTAWRVLPDGTFWIGPESWPESDIDFDVIQEEPHLGRDLLALDTPTLLPGTTFRNARVEYVSHHLHPEKVRSLVWRSA